MILRYTLIFSILLGFCNTSVFASAEALKEWLPERLHPRAAEISQIIAQEKREQIYCDKPTQDYGYSVPGLNQLQVDCLVEIAKKFKAANYKREEVQVFDGAAGYGNMSYKMALAGGFVSAIELQKEAAKTLNHKLFKTLKQFNCSDQPQTAYRPIHGDVFCFNGPAYDRKYQVTWIGYFLHFLPAQLTEAFFAQLYKSSAEDGIVCATVNAPGICPAIVKMYKDRLAAGDPNPGYIVLNKWIYRSRSQQRNTQVALEGVVLPKLNESLHPGEEREGFYGECQDSSAWVRTEDPDVVGRKVHSIMHLMGPTEVTKRFQNAGFTIEDIYYVNSSNGGKIPIQAMTDEELAKDTKLLAIKVRKPKVKVEQPVKSSDRQP